MLLEAMETEPQRLRAVPEPRRGVDLTVADVAELPRHTDVYLGERVADLLDGGGVERRHRRVALRYVRRAVLVPLLFGRLALVRGTAAQQAELADPEKTVFGAEHVLAHL